MTVLTFRNWFYNFVHFSTCAISWRLGVIFLCHVLRVHIYLQDGLLCASHWKFLAESFGFFGKCHLLDFCLTESFCPVIFASPCGKPVYFLKLSYLFVFLFICKYVHSLVGQLLTIKDDVLIHPVSDQEVICVYIYTCIIYI